MVKKSSKYIKIKCSHRAFRPILIGKHAHRKGNLSMFEFSRNPKIALLVDNQFDERALSQERRVPRDRQTFSMHHYLLVESHRKASVTLWVHPFKHREQT